MRRKECKLIISGKQIAEQISQTYEQVVHAPKLVHPAIPAAKVNPRKDSRAA